jgi:subtilisin family serine protease
VISPLVATFGITWTRAIRRRFVATCLAVAILFSMPGLAGTSAFAALHRATSQLVSVIVRERPGATAPDRVIKAVGGAVGRRFAALDSLVAEVPRSAIPVLQTAQGVVSVTPNVRLHLLSGVYSSTSGSYSEASDPYSIYNLTQHVGAQKYWAAGYTGKGVDIALIDSGVAPVDGLTASGKVVNGPDVSFESQAPNLRYLDTFGHGTHMAGIIAGRDNEAVAGSYVGDSTHFIGVAPDARIVSIKAADSHGATDVSQVLAAIDWVVQHKNDNGLNIRVLNLSFGTDSNQEYYLDPLAYAVEVAWFKGIFVSASAGNQGFGTALDGLSDPAYDPYVLAVGASVSQGSSYSGDSVASFSSVSLRVRTPDVVVPGAHVQSLRDPGSYVDVKNSSTGLINSRFFRGSGTSQAAAFASGVAALVISQRPSATPDQVKALLKSTAVALAFASSSSEGSGEVNLASTLKASVPLFSTQSYLRSTGTGTLEASRGNAHLVANGVTLSGEQDIFGHAVNTTTLASLEGKASAWSGGVWNGNTWEGSGWTASTWAGTAWATTQWQGSSWYGVQWSNSTWDNNTWSNNTWSNSTWDDNTWDNSTWDNNTWSNSTWDDNTWDSGVWTTSCWS